MKWVILLAAMGGLLYWLYDNGHMILQSKRAAVFIGGRGARRASFTACSGHIRRVVRFAQDGEVNFSFDCELTKGTVSVELFDEERRSVLRLDSSQTVKVPVSRERRYSLVVTFRAATGKYTVDWQ